MTGYLYDGDCVVAEFDARGKVGAQYIHGQGLGADVGSLICAQTLGADGAASERYYSHNWRGDTIGITDESGASLARYRYGAFGDLIAGDGGIANNILFSGKRYDSASGLYYFGARYYDASSGRFISRDPMGYIDGPNEYVLAMNNPLLWIDPWGLWKRSAWNTAVNAFDYVSGVSSVNAMSIFNPVPENPLGTVDPIPEFKPIIKWITPILENIIQDIRDPNPGPQAPLDDINPNPGPQKPLHNITYFPTPQPWDDGILRKGNTPPPNEKTKPTISAVKNALKEVHRIVGKIVGKSASGKTNLGSSPTRSSEDKGYRLDINGHPNRSSEDPESGAHINYWDYSKGKRSSGLGIKGFISIK